MFIELHYFFFSGDARENKELTKLTAENRQTFVKIINDLNADGGTCLGKGLKQGMDVRKRIVLLLLLFFNIYVNLNI